MPDFPGSPRHALPPEAKKIHAVNINTHSTNRAQEAIALWDIAADKTREPEEREEARMKLGEVLTKATGRPISVELTSDPIMGEGISLRVDQSRRKSR